jgi:2',3'-cyclic-nucleotide 2'-phosphodiesterase (5'-nucleotidase family)
MKYRTLVGLLFFTTLVSFSSCSLKNPLKKGEKENIEINQSSSTDSSVIAVVAPYKAELDLKMSEVLNVSKQEMIVGRPESNLGDFVADLSFKVASDLYHPLDGDSIDFCLFSVGGLRNSIAKGPITLGNVFELMPFENELMVITLSYEQTMDLFEYVAISGGEPISHARFKIKNGLPSDIKIKDENPDSNRTYKVLTSDYLARGGDKMYFFLDPIYSEKVGIKLREAIILYLEEEAKKGRTINVLKDGRIVDEE